MESQFPDKSGAAANEGTAAHELAAWSLMMHRPPGDMLGRVIDINATNDATRFLQKGSPLDGDTRWPVTEEMVEAVEVYTSHVNDLGGERAIEQRLSMQHVHEDIWGTGDALVYVAEEEHLHIVDLKYGRGVLVEVVGNMQLALYASGAAAWLNKNHGHKVSKITATIVQPRVDHPDGRVRSITMDVSDLDTQMAEIAEKAKRVDAAREGFIANPKTPALQSQMTKWQRANLAAGTHCRFCKAGAVCTVRADKMLADAQAEFDDVTGAMTLPEPSTLAPETLADLLGKAREIQHWVNAVEAFANAEAHEGRVPPGYKLVAKRATRAWADESVAREMIPMLTALGETDMLSEPKLLSPAQMEKRLSKEERAALAPFITSNSSGMNLVPDDDHRPAAKAKAEDEFTAV